MLKTTMPRGRPKKDDALSNAERKARYRARALAGAATAEAIDAAASAAFETAYTNACLDAREAPLTVLDIVAQVVAGFPPADARRVRARLGMPTTDGLAWDEELGV